MVLRNWKIVLLTLFLLLPMAGVAQVEEDLEQWVEETEETGAVADLNDLLIELQERPVNINDTHAVAALPFITPFQAKALSNYILLNGQLLSLKELRYVPGFDSNTVALLRLVAKAEPYHPQTTWHLKDGHHQVVTGIGGTVEQAQGYRNGRYEGDNLRAMLLYKYQLNNKIEVRLVADKDPTEAWGKSNYYGYHLMVTDVGRLKKLVVGRYSLQFGQGLTLWTGLRPFNLTGSTPLRYSGGVRAASAFYETGYQEGVAAKVDVGRGVYLTAFGSWLEEENMAGARIDYRHGNLAAGLTTVYSNNDSLHAGIDAVWQRGKTTLYGEVAVGTNGKPAAIGGVQIQADSRNRFGVSYRYYHPEYHNLHAQGYAIGGTQGEQGVTLSAESRLPLDLTLLVSLDAHRFPTLRYANYRPSTGNWLRMQLGRQWGQHISTTLRYSYRQKERNIPNYDSALYVGEETVREQLQGEVKGVMGQWTLSARGNYVRFDSEHGEPQQGWLAGLTARYTASKIQATAAVAWFDVDNYYARIYFSESNLQYFWSMPALNGRGLRAYTVVRWHLAQHLTIAAKYALTWLPGETSMGSGNSLTEGPLRQNWFLQLRSSF